MLAVTAFPILYAIWLSLLDYRIGQPVRFVGAGNYAALVHDAQFWNGLQRRIEVAGHVDFGNHGDGEAIG